ncbi:hypothetical protein Tco_0091708 [Tanacetum coccineum]
MDYDQLFEEFNVGAARQICLGSEVRSRTEHELELKEKLQAKYDARGVLLREKDGNLLELKFFGKRGRRPSPRRFPRLRIRLSSVLTVINHFLRGGVGSEEAVFTEVLQRDGLASETRARFDSSFLLFVILKEKMEAQQEAQAQVMYNRMADIEDTWVGWTYRFAWRGNFIASYLTLWPGHRWLLTHGVGACYGEMVEIVAYNPETAEANYLDAVRALEEADFPLVHLLKSKDEIRVMDEGHCCFYLDVPLADLPEAAYLQPCLEQLSVPIYHADVNVVVGETSLSFSLLNVHTRAEGAKKHDAALRQLMVDIVSHPLSSQNLLGEASTSVAAPCVEDLDTDEDLDVVCYSGLCMF